MCDTERGGNKQNLVSFAFIFQSRTIAAYHGIYESFRNIFKVHSDLTCKQCCIPLLWKTNTCGIFFHELLGPTLFQLSFLNSIPAVRSSYTIFQAEINRDSYGDFLRGGSMLSFPTKSAAVLKGKKPKKPGRHCCLGCCSFCTCKSQCGDQETQIIMKKQNQ